MLELYTFRIIFGDHGTYKILKSNQDSFFFQSLSEQFA